MAKARSYADQAFRVLDRAKTKIRYNHEWLSELSFGDVVRLASNFTVQQFLARENFAKRFERNDAIWLHEFFYALMQGYDAVAQQTDVQIGGRDQLFNLMAGRKLMEAHGMKPQVVLTFPILEGTDGVVRMSKSAGNYIGIDEPPGVIFTKVLNLPDTVMRNYAELVTRWSQEEIDALFADMAAGTHRGARLQAQAGVGNREHLPGRRGGRPGGPGRRTHARGPGAQRCAGPGTCRADEHSRRAVRRADW